MVWEITFAAALTVAAVVQAGVAIYMYRLQRRLERFQEETEEKRRPLFRVHFNGFQSQPENPRKEALKFMFTIVNEGRAQAKIGNRGIRVMAPDGPREAGSFAFRPWKPGTTIDFDHRKPNPPGWDIVDANDAKSYIAILPAGGRWHEWERVELFLEPIGGKGLADEIEWKERLFWLDGEASG